MTGPLELTIINQPRVFPYRKGYQTAKRVMDVALCLLALPVALPLMVICALVTCIDSPGPVLFIQDRIGKGGQRFRMYKFRTMQSDLDDGFHRTFMKAYINGQIVGGEDEDGVSDGFRCPAVKASASVPSGDNGKDFKTYKPAKSSQLTRVGRILRRTSLDELPQIFNVLRGEMSLVGPRPNVSWEVEEYRIWHHERLEVLPGITGLAQVRGRSGLLFDRIVEYDIEYVEKRGLALDLKILWWTMITVVVGGGAG